MNLPLVKFFMQLAHETDPLSQGKTYTYMADFVNMLISLAVIIGLLFATVWVLKKIMQSRITQLNDTSAIRVLEKRVLNQKACLYLVEVMGKGVLISESTAGIQLLSEVTGEEWEAELQTLNQPEASAPQESLIQWWRKWTGRYA